MAREVYGWSWLPRSGLGNMLFPWARCLVWCKDNGCEMIGPVWFKVRLGPYLRRERDKRHYWKLFHAGGAITGLRRLWLLARLPMISEEVGRERATNLRRCVVLFRGMTGLFEPIIGRHREVLNGLTTIVRRGCLPTRSAKGYIGIHVRRGDFAVPTDTRLLMDGGWNYRIPIEWYLQCLREVRAAAGSCVPATVVSDGSGNELDLLMSEPGVTWHRGRSAIEDLLWLSSSSVIIASGSTFSMWASYLGQAPSLWFPGQLRQRVVTAWGEDCVAETEWAPDRRLPGSFIALLERRLERVASDFNGH